MSSLRSRNGPRIKYVPDESAPYETIAVDKLVIYPERMRGNLEALGGLVHSQRVLLALTQAGMSREDAYRAVQRNAMPAWEGKARFLDLLQADAEIARYLSPAALAALFDDAFHTQHVDTIFARVFGAG